MGSVAGPEKVKKPLAPERLEEALVPLSQSGFRSSGIHLVLNSQEGNYIAVYIKLYISNYREFTNFLQLLLGVGAFFQ